MVTLTLEYVNSSRSIVGPPVKQGGNGPGPPALHLIIIRKFQNDIVQVWKITNFDRQAALFNGCFFGCNYSGIFWGSTIELARPDGAVTFTRSHEPAPVISGMCSWDCREPQLPKKYRVDLGSHNISGSTILCVQVVQKQVGAWLHSCWEDSVGIC
jgi:hypothetical protein